MKSCFHETGTKQYEEEIASNDDNEDHKETKHTMAELKFSLKTDNNKINDAEDWS